jgi:hypothetical protein
VRPAARGRAVRLGPCQDLCDGQPRPGPLRGRVERPTEVPTQGHPARQAAAAAAQRLVDRAPVLAGRAGHRAGVGVGPEARGSAVGIQPRPGSWPGKASAA